MTIFRNPQLDNLFYQPLRDRMLKLCPAHEIVYARPTHQACPLCDVEKEIDRYQRENEAQRQTINLLKADLLRLPPEKPMTTWLDHSNHTQPHKGCHLCAEAWQRRGTS